MALPSWTAPFINRVYPYKEKITRRTLHEEAVSPEQVVRILNKAGIGAKNSDLFRKYGVSEQTFHNLRTQCGDMSIGDVRKLKALEGKPQINRVLKNKNQAVRQGARRCDKRSIFRHM